MSINDKIITGTSNFIRKIFKKEAEPVPENDLTQAKELIKRCQETQYPYLDLGNCGITDLNDLPELFECLHLKTLILSNRWWDIEKKKYRHSHNKGEKNKLILSCF